LPADGLGLRRNPYSDDNGSLTRQAPNSILRFRSFFFGFSNELPFVLAVRRDNCMTDATDRSHPSAAAKQGDSSSLPVARPIWPVLPFEDRIAAARNGSSSAIGSVLEECRNYLLLIANRELGQSFQAKIGASDLVQETFLQAHEIFDRFQGRSRQELAAWLAQILEYKLAQTKRHFLHTEKRSTSQESISFVEKELLRDFRLTERSSPYDAAAHQDELEKFRHVLDRLPAEYSLAIELRGLQQKSFAELGQALNRTPDAARMIWARAMLRLRREMRGEGGER
jgi:RNA polymerase sigma-70 factor, ECF subfamily